MTGDSRGNIDGEIDLSRKLIDAPDGFLQDKGGQYQPGVLSAYCGQKVAGLQNMPVAAPADENFQAAQPVLCINNGLKERKDVMAMDGMDKFAL